MSWFEFYGDDYFESLFMKALGRDEAYLRIINNGPKIPVYLLKTHRECIECNYYMDKVIYESEDFNVKSNYKYQISRTEKGIHGGSNVICNLTSSMGEFGVYNVTFDDKKNCVFETLKEPVNIYLPMLTVFFIYLALICLFLCGKYLDRRIWNREGADVSKNDVDKSTSSKTRIKSLDTFRGISIVIMIFVNLGAGGYDILDHAPWNGLHLADVVFPCFLWIMGACIPISLVSSFKREVTNKSLILTVTIRSIKLFCIGIFLNSGIYFYNFRVMGVLQRFGICYFVVTVICIYLLNRSLLINKEELTPNFVTNLKITMLAWIPVICIGVTHLLIVFLVSDVGCESGYFGPGGLHKYKKYEKCTGGATGYLDRAILGRHAYQHPTCSEVYKSLAFDPEGLIGCLNSIVHTFIGVQAGVIVLVYKDHKTRIAHWLTWAVFSLILGACLCGFSIEEGWIPVNKNLWSLSFVLVTSGIAFTLLALCYVLIDMKKWWRGQPFFYAGMNSILMYIGHAITTGFFPFSWKINDYDTQTHFLFLLENVTSTAIWIFIAYHLYKIKFFFSV